VEAGRGTGGTKREAIWGLFRGLLDSSGCMDIVRYPWVLQDAFFFVDSVNLRSRHASKTEPSYQIMGGVHNSTVPAIPRGFPITLLPSISSGTWRLSTLLSQLGCRTWEELISNTEHTQNGIFETDNCDYQMRDAFLIFNLEQHDIMVFSFNHLQGEPSQDPHIDQPNREGKNKSEHRN
jgi:hypothetical protein